MATLGSRVKELREGKGITQRELGELMKYKNTRSVQSIEANKQTIDNIQIVFLADYFEVSTDYLLGRSDDPTLR